jgi:hypothetical protein
MPFPDTIEGLIYAKNKLLKASALWKMQGKMAIYPPRGCRRPPVFAFIPLWMIDL